MQPHDSIPYGFCHCGCGQKTNLAKQSRYGYIKGEPVRFIHGHQGRVFRPPHNPRTLSERFWERVKKTEDCWLWSGLRYSNGYGHINASGHNGANLLAHRVSWEIHNGPIPDGYHVCHKCDTPPCVNPEHLFLGTRSDNMRDMHAKGRGMHGASHWACQHPERIKRGERHQWAKLTAEQVKEIRRRRPSESLAQLAADFGVTKQLISKIALGHTWKHL